MRQTIDGAAFRRMAISASAAIDNHKQKINDLNVFPVPDGDTGTNMSMTFQNAVQDLRKAEDPTLTKAADIVASALLRGARGNSGVILSLLFRGFAKSLKGKTEADGTDLALALTEGVEAAYKAVMKPAEGTILTVSRVSAAAGVEAAKADPGAESVLEQIILSAQDALEKTTHQNPVLKKAGVVDAGGMGYIVILQGMLASLQGNDVIPAEPSDTVREAADFSDFDTEEITFPYCTEFIVSRETDLDPEDLRAFLAQIGDSLVLVDDERSSKYMFIPIIRARLWKRLSATAALSPLRLRTCACSIPRKYSPQRMRKPSASLPSLPAWLQSVPAPVLLAFSTIWALTGLWRAVRP